MSAVTCDWIIFCEHAFMDSDGRYCIIGMMERIRMAPGKETAAPPRLCVVAQFRAAPSTRFEAEIRVVNPGGEVGAVVPQSLVATEAGAVCALLTLDPGVELSEGAYRFEARDGVGVLVRSATLQVLPPLKAPVH